MVSRKVMLGLVLSSLKTFQTVLETGNNRKRLFQAKKKKVVSLFLVTYSTQSLNYSLSSTVSLWRTAVH